MTRTTAVVEDDERSRSAVLSTLAVRSVDRSCLAVLVASLGACAHTAPTPIGMTREDRTAVETAPSSSASASSLPLETWSSAGTFRTWTRANVRRFISSGHLLGKVDGDVFVSADAADGYARIAPGRALPVGAIVAEAHSNGDKAGPIFAMERGEEGWTFVEMDADARVVRRGAIAPCVGCHAHVADQDMLFGVPVPGR
jgi:hypothetical protein